jgi:hypothetical protein
MLVHRKRQQIQQTSIYNKSHSKSDNKFKHEEIIQMFLLTTYFFRGILKNIDNTLV